MNARLIESNFRPGGTATVIAWIHLLLSPSGRSFCRDSSANGRTSDLGVVTLVQAVSCAKQRILANRDSRCG